MKILATQTYGRGETPVFIAFLDTESGVAVSPDDYAAVTFSHLRNDSVLLGGFKSIPGLERLGVPLESILPAPVDSPVAFDGTNTTPFSYNFLFLPNTNDAKFYLDASQYRTVFEFLRKDGRIESLIFDSVCVTPPVATLKFGFIPTFTDTIRTKTIDDTGVVKYDHEGVTRIMRTVLNASSKPIESETEIPLDSLVEGAFLHTPEKNLFPSTGQYTVKVVPSTIQVVRPKGFQPFGAFWSNFRAICLARSA